MSYNRGDNGGSNLAQRARLLDEQQIVFGLADSIKNLTDGITVLPSVGSTNAFLLNETISVGRARLCVAESQDVGRGRRGRSWLSSPYRNILMSISWGFNQWPETLTGLGLAASLTITERLRQNYQLDIKIKWPNDLMLEDKKLAGILIDISGQHGGACNVVLGLGLNVDQADWSEPAAAPAYAWQDLLSAGAQVDRNSLIAELYSDLLQMLQLFEQRGFAPMVDKWNSLSNYAGRQIRVCGTNIDLQGNMLGVDEQGALRVADSNGMEHQITDSNVSVRLLT